MKYILLTEAKRKNAKRHIVDRFNSKEEALRIAENINKERYRIFICKGNYSECEEVK